MAGFFNQIKQASQMMQNMSQLKHEAKNLEKALAAERAECAVADGRVKVVARGDMRVESIEIAPELLVPDKANRLQEWLLNAVNGALRDAKNMAGKHVSKLAGGLNLPGMGG